MEAPYCQPGVHGAHVKGGVEGQIGWLRPTGLGPVVKVASSVAVEDEIPVSLALDLNGQRK
ncbi:hypothetical protein, partial [Streptomyces venezuelae]|uniref:hypothetical protein n=1 Tax=Streptomyces venezuelae TaxID=54571 RepID=UPI00362A2367